MSVRMETIRVRKGWIVAGLLVLIAGGALTYRSLGLNGPDAIAHFVSSPIELGIEGDVSFRNVSEGVMITVNVRGLPAYNPGPPPIGPHGFHIHEGASCEVGDPADPFQSAGGHWNPDNQPHGNHAGDFPVLFSNDGRASMSFFSNRFTVEDIIGRTIVIHLNPDDYRSQPSGNSGLRIACGVIERA